MRLTNSKFPCMVLLLIITSGIPCNRSYQTLEYTMNDPTSNLSANVILDRVTNGNIRVNSNQSPQDSRSSFIKSAEFSDFGQNIAKETLQRAFHENLTEFDVAEQIKFHMIDAGADNILAFSSIVASGTDSVLPHGDLTNDKFNYILPGEAVVVDLGAKYAGYSTDITRTYFIGPPTEIQKQIYEIVLEAQQAGIDAISPGVNASSVAQAARGVIAAYGYEKYFTHLTGHGLGAYVHDDPLIGINSIGVLKPGMAITVEPGIYLPAEDFGVRIEDDILVTDTGYEMLTHSPKTLSDVTLFENSTIGFPSVQITHPQDASQHCFDEMISIRAEILAYNESYPIDQVQCKITGKWQDMVMQEESKYEYAFSYTRNMSGFLQIAVRAFSGDQYRTDFVGMVANLCGTPIQESLLPDTYQSAHPYQQDTNRTWTVQHSGAAQIRVHFTVLQIAYFSHLYLRDHAGNVYMDYEGYDLLNADLWSPWIPTDSLLLHLEAALGRAYGFQIDKYEIPIEPQSIPGYTTISTIFVLFVLYLIYKRRKRDALNCK